LAKISAGAAPWMEVSGSKNPNSESRVGTKPCYQAWWKKRAWVKTNGDGKARGGAMGSKTCG